MIGLPAHLAGYAEPGVLRRLRASTVPLPAVLAAQAATAVVAAVAGGVRVVAVDAAVYHAAGPRQPVGVTVAVLVCALTFAALGILLGSLFRSSRAAQGWGELLWFVMMMVSGTGPPPEILTGGLGVAATISPLRQAVLAVQDPWLGVGWNLPAMAAVALVGVAAATGAALLTARR